MEVLANEKCDFARGGVITPPLQNHVFHLLIFPIFQKWLYEMSRSVKGLGYWLIFSSKSKFFSFIFLHLPTDF